MTDLQKISVAEHRHKILPYQEILKLIENRFVVSEEELVNPASLDIATPEAIYLKRGEPVTFTPNTYLPANHDSNIDFFLMLKSTTARIGITIKPIEAFASGRIQFQIESFGFESVFIPAGTPLLQAVFYDKRTESKNIECTFKIDEASCFKQEQHVNIGGTYEKYNLYARHEPFTVFSEYEYLCSTIPQQTNVFTDEYAGVIHMPNSHVMIIEPNSDGGQMSICHGNSSKDELYAGFIDPGFNGSLALEVRPECKILLIEVRNTNNFGYTVELTEPTQKPYNGNYQNKGIFPKICY